MFSSSKRNDMDSPSESAYRSPQGGATVIAKGVKVEGDFTSQGDVIIEGEVHGKISAAGTLTVGSEAVIKADVTADEAIISGSIEGNLNVKKQVVLHATARVKGDLNVERATIEAGALLEGRVQIGQSMPAAVKSSARAGMKSMTSSPVEMAAGAE